MSKSSNKILVEFLESIFDQYFLLYREDLIGTVKITSYKQNKDGSANITLDFSDESEHCFIRKGMQRIIEDLDLPLEIEKIETNSSKNKLKKHELSFVINKLTAPRTSSTKFMLDEARLFGNGASLLTNEEANSLIEIGIITMFQEYLRNAKCF